MLHTRTHTHTHTHECLLCPDTAPLLLCGVHAHRDFKKHVAALDADARPPMDFTVQVLTTGFWPTYKQVQVALPAEFTSCQSIFTSYYDSITSHRKLKWMYTLGTAAVKGHYAKTYDFQVTTLQAVTMLVFNHKTGDVPFTDLRAAVNVDEDIMKRLLHSLSCGKYHVLKKTPSGRTISTSDTFRFNDAFVCPLVKVGWCLGCVPPPCCWHSRPVRVHRRFASPWRRWTTPTTRSGWKKTGPSPLKRRLCAQ